MQIICKAVSSTNPPREYYASTSFWFKIDGEIENFNIIDLSVDKAYHEDDINIDNTVGVKTGGYIAHEVITDNDRAVFDYITKSLLGVDYTN